MKMNPFSKGLTFLELLITIGLIFLFATLTLPMGINFYRKITVEDLAQALKAALREAQAAAISNRGQSNAGVKIEPGKYIIFEGNSYQTRRAALDISYSYPGGVEIKGISEVIFQMETGLPIFPGLISHWQLNNTEGSAIYDYSLYENLNHGEISGTFSWVEGKDQRALELSGGKIEIPHHSSLNPEKGITLSLWIYINQVESKNLIKKGNPQGNPPNGYRLALEAAENTILFEIGDGSNPQILSNQFNPEEIIGKWIQIVAVWDGQIMAQYLNGKKLPQTKEFNQEIAPSLENLIIAENFNGKIDDIRIYNYGLSEKEIEANYLAKKDDLVISLEFQGRESEIFINHQGLTSAFKK